VTRSTATATDAMRPAMALVLPDARPDYAFGVASGLRCGGESRTTTQVIPAAAAMMATMKRANASSPRTALIAN